MNNDNRSNYTPLMLQLLIRELFKGQTVPIREIITKVDEVIRDRGGRLPSNRIHHPVTYALLRLKEDGFANNTEGGDWFIFPERQSKKPSRIETFDQFIKWAKECSRGDYVFRGVPNAEYRIQASAYRRPKEKERNFEKFLQINRDLIREARLRGYDEKDGRALKELEILAELQHFGAATCLIDFTHNAQVALRFACEVDQKNPQATPDGKVFAVRNSRPRFKEIIPALLEKDIDYFLKDGWESQLYHWSPRQQNPRIIAQQSIFLFGGYEVFANKVCIIDAERKREILEELEQVSSINEDRLFPDFEGFARVRREEILYTELTATQYKVRGHESYDTGNYREAISDYDRVIDLNSGDHEIYYLIGMAKYELRQYPEALDDFTDAIRLKSDLPEYHFMQGLARFEINQLSEAKQSFNNAINLMSGDGRFYKAKAEVCGMMEEHEEAIDCYDRAIDLEFSGSSEIYYWRGMQKYYIFRFSEAVDDFTLAIDRDPQDANYYFWRSRAKEHAEGPESANRDLKTALRIAKENGAINLIDSYRGMFPTLDYDRLIDELPDGTQ